MRGAGSGQAPCWPNERKRLQGAEGLSQRSGKQHFDASLQALAVASIFYHLWAIYNAGYGKPDLDRF